jgi:hypothetical protein
MHPTPKRAEKVDIAVGSSPINRAACRKMIFARLEILRPALFKKMTRVSESSFTYLEARVQNIIDGQLCTLSTLGSTIYLDR